MAPAHTHDSTFAVFSRIILCLVVSLLTIALTQSVLGQTTSVWSYADDSTADGSVLSLPRNAPDLIASVIAVEVEGASDVKKILPSQLPDGTLRLNAQLADIHNRLGSNTRLEIRNNISNIGYWTNPQSWVEWQFKIDKPGSFAIHAEIANPEPNSRAVVRIGDIERVVSFPPTGDYGMFQSYRLAVVTLDEPGTYTLQIRPVREAWNPINLRSIALKPVPAIVVWAAEQRDLRMQWWREARFGMFVHWGLYSGLAGTWNGEPVATRGGMEWIQNRVNADTKIYAECAIPLFKPSPNFATEWAELAKAAGCRYIVFTTKHHDGFSLHDSKIGQFNAGEVLKRDLVREIVDAARDAGLRIGFYHSVIDWHHPEYDYTRSQMLPHPFRGTPPAQPRNHDKYLDYLHAQVDELISNYGPIDIMWWDYSALDFYGQTAWRAFDLMDMVRTKQPHIIMNNRLFRIPQAGWAAMGTSGFAMHLDPIYADFITPEQHIPATGVPDLAWETCMTMNTTWGFSEHDHAWKSSEMLIRNLVDIASKGGNYLLNIGPKADGSVPTESIERMQDIGRWMQINSESIYGTSASPFTELEWGRCTQQSDGDDTLLYLHVFDWPDDCTLVVPGLRNDISEAKLLASGRPLATARRKNDVLIQLPTIPLDTINTVIILKIKGTTALVEQ